MRTPEQLLKALEMATKEKPLILKSDEGDNFRIACRMSWPETEKVKTIIQDKDILLRNGVSSPADGKIYGNRKDWNDHLKARGLHEVGNDMRKPPSQPQGNFNCREALTKATRQVLEKNGHR